MNGSIIGDIIGSPYEFIPHKTKVFPLFSSQSAFTDDTVMTVAVASALIGCGRFTPDGLIKKRLVYEMRWWGRRYPDAGYGELFYKWLWAKKPKPYNSLGNGSAMRVSSVAWLFPKSLERCQHIARLTAEVTHNHPEGIKGAEAVASAEWLALHGYDKKEIRDYLEETYSYALDRKIDDIRPSYRHIETCPDSVPEAILCFLESVSYESAVRNAVSLGGDADTQAAIAGGIAECFYGVPDIIKVKAMPYIPKDMTLVLDTFNKQVESGKAGVSKKNPPAAGQRLNERKL